MRSTWTWDDRALRRDLAVLLVDVDAATAAATSDDHTRPDPRPDAACAGHPVGGAFRRHGARAEVGRRHGKSAAQHFLTLAMDPTRFDSGRTGFASVREEAPAYFAAATQRLEYPRHELVGPGQAGGTTGLGAAMRGYGNALRTRRSSGTRGWPGRRCGGSRVVSGRVRSSDPGTNSATLAAAEQTGSWDPAGQDPRRQTPEGWTIRAQAVRAWCRIRGRHLRHRPIDRRPFTVRRHQIGAGGDGDAARRHRPHQAVVAD